MTVDLVIESEPTVLLIGGDMDIPGQDDVIQLVRREADPSLLDVFVNEEAFGPFNFAEIGQIEVDAGGGNDLLTVDAAHGLIHVPLGIRYDGGSGFDRLDLTAGEDDGQLASGIVVGANPGQGMSRVANAVQLQVVTFENVEPITDNVPAVIFSITGTPGAASLLDAANAINYTAGQLLADSGRVTIDQFEPIEFRHKSILEINAGAGADEINLNNPDLPTDLTAIEVRGNDPTVSDTMIVNGTASFDVITVSNFTGDEAMVSGAQRVPVTVETTEHLIINGNGGIDNLTVVGSDRSEAFQHTPGLALDSGRIDLASLGDGITLLGLNYQNIGLYGTLMIDGGDGDDSLHVAGTAGADDLQVGSNGPDTLAVSHSTEFGARVNLAASGIEDYSVAALGGDDFVTVDDSLDVRSLFLTGGGEVTDVLLLDGTEEPLGDVTVRPDLDVGVDQNILGLGDTTIDVNGFGLIQMIGRDDDTLTVELGGGDDAARVDRGSGIGRGSDTPPLPSGRVRSTSLPQIEFIELAAFTLTSGAGADSLTFQTRFLTGADAYRVNADAADTLFIEGNDASADDYDVTSPDADRVSITDNLGSLATVTTLAGGMPGAIEILGLGGNDRIELDAVVLSTPARTSLTIRGGEGDDTLDGEGVVDDDVRLTLFGDGGNDRLIGGDSTTGTAAGDFLFGGPGDDFLDGGRGQDQFFGETGSDLLLWVIGDGNDLMEGGAGESDVMQFVGSDAANRMELFGGGLFGAVTNPSPNVFLPGTLQNASRSIFALNSTAQDAAAVFLNMGDVETIQIDALGGADSIVVNNQMDVNSSTVNPIQRGTDLAHTSVRAVDIDLSSSSGPMPDGAIDSIDVHGRSVADEIQVSCPKGTATIDVAGFSYSLRVLRSERGGLLGGATDLLSLFGREGNDRIEVAQVVATVAAIAVHGNEGDDWISADAVVITGGTGNDFLRGGDNGNLLQGNDGEDTFVGGLGGDSIDGGPGFDTILIAGTSGNDRIDAMQVSGTSLQHIVGGSIGDPGTQTDTLAFGTVEEARIEAGSGDDVIRVTPSEALIVAGMESASLRFTVLGGAATTRDRLAVRDEGLGDLIVQRLGATSDAGTFQVANLAPVVYDGIEFTQVTPLNSSTAGTGSDDAGRLVVFRHDAFEPNDARPVAWHLGAGESVNLSANIDPGADATFDLPGDEDWFRFVAETTGTLDVQVYFEQIGTLANGRAGLPNAGNLDLAAFDSSGDAITGFGSNDATDDERLRLPVVAGRTYFVRVSGAADAINAYELTAVNYGTPVPFDLELDDLLTDGTPNPPGNAHTSDTGRSQRDNVTYDATPQIFIRLDDDNLLHDLPGNPAPDAPPDEVIPIPFDASQTAVPATAGYRVAVFDEGRPQQPGQPPQSPIGYARKLAGGNGVYVFDFEIDALAAPYVLTDGSHFLSAKVQITDPATPRHSGFGDRSASLEIVVDTVAPPVHFGLPELPLALDPNGRTHSDGLVPDSDFGIDGAGFPGSGSDGITRDTTPTFWGIGEANAFLRAYVDANGNGTIETDVDVFIGATVVLPYDGTDQFGNLPEPLGEGMGFWQLTSVVSLNDPNAFPTPLDFDGPRTILLTAEDVAGNITDGSNPVSVATLDFFIDTQGPQIYDPDGDAAAHHAIEITGEPSFNLFDLKPTPRPTPLINSLTIHVRDLPNRAARFLYPALAADADGNPAENPGHYQVVGDHNGIVAISSIEFIPDPDPAVAGNPAFGRIVLTFASPLPDDRFTLTVYDGIIDPAGNPLDGESNADEPNEAPQFPTGDGIPGGDFVARFTVDSRAELGVWAAGSVYVDTNGNFALDVEGQDGDDTNEDIAYVLGFTSDNIFAGNFKAPGAAAADGFDKIAAYGYYGGGYRWLIDTDNDGVPNLALNDPSDIDGLPFAGDFAAANSGDEVGLKKGNTWYLDTNANYVINAGEALPGNNMVGQPIVGDFDGDGIDDLGAWADNRFSLNLSTLGPIDGFEDVGFTFGFAGVKEKPLAADFDGDGIDDIGLWVPDRSGATPAETAEWYILVSGDRSITSRIVPALDGGANTVYFEPLPFGHDIYSQFSDDFALPVPGNFDPPVMPSSGGPAAMMTDTNWANPLDVTGDGNVGPQDVLAVINTINGFGDELGTLGLLDDVYPDINGDSIISAADVLPPINFLNEQAALSAGGSSEGEEAGDWDALIAQLAADVARQSTVRRASTSGTLAGGRSVIDSPLAGRIVIIDQNELVLQSPQDSKPAGGRIVIVDQNELALDLPADDQTAAGGIVIVDVNEL